MARFVFLKYPFWNLPFCIITNFFLLSCIFFCDCEINVMVLVHILFINKRCRFRNARLKCIRNYSSIFEPLQNNGSIYVLWLQARAIKGVYIRPGNWQSRNLKLMKNLHFNRHGQVHTSIIQVSRTKNWNRECIIPIIIIRQKTWIISRQPSALAIWAIWKTKLKKIYLIFKQIYTSWVD